MDKGSMAPIRAGITTVTFAWTGKGSVAGAMGYFEISGINSLS
ncbi:MAG: hypothetical protein ACI89U_003231 [Gammaproteobacteria bacterium]|jgi:hypothetical protein